MHLHEANCWLLHLVLPESSVGSTKLSGLGSGHVFERARVCGSNVSCKSVTMSISPDNPSKPRGGDGHDELNESILDLFNFFFFSTLQLFFNERKGSAREITIFLYVLYSTQNTVAQKVFFLITILCFEQFYFQQVRNVCNWLKCDAVDEEKSVSRSNTFR